MGFTKIEPADLVGRGVVGLPDTPNLTTTAMQEKFDELALQVIIPKINNLIAELESKTASANIGVEIPAPIALELEDVTIQTILETISHLHDNKSMLDKLAEDESGKPLYDGKLLSGDAFASITVGGQLVTATNTDNLTFIAGDNVVIDVDPTEKTVKFTALGGGGGAGDMYTAVYDKDKDGIVDNASALGGNPPSYYQPVESEDLNTTDKNIVNAINEVKETADEANAKEVDVYTTMEQVNASTDPKVPVGSGAVKELSDSLQNKLAYSETETVCGTWIDGKPIYRKIVFPPALVSITLDVWNNLGIVIPNISQLVRADNVSFTGCFGFKYDNGLMVITSIPNFVIGEYHAILVEYTKTTD